MITEDVYVRGMLPLRNLKSASYTSKLFENVLTIQLSLRSVDYAHYNADRLCCTNPFRDSSRESSVIGGGHEQTKHTDLQDAELARV